MNNNAVLGWTLATFRMQKMVDFYSNVFGLQFREQEMAGQRLFSAKWHDMNILLCPAQLAGIQAQQNRHQLDISVHDIEVALKRVKEYGGKPMGEIHEDLEAFAIAIKDPDENSMVLKQLKS